MGFTVAAGSDNAAGDAAPGPYRLGPGRLPSLRRPPAPFVAPTGWRTPRAFLVPWPGRVPF
ncbi:hypothetical protein HEK616_65390 [Streptomyces nigrescens]|uniref:Uncharacterized protein n=1 Tax=Streptomyces nigrescens TaxID=1920 RepID=A0ABN6R3Q8_STRNI|nr:hypothetical protein HEK616_65390 [Streptomyces nigrescens]